MRAKRGLVILCCLKGPLSLWPSKKKRLWGRRNPTQLSVGGSCDYSVSWRLKPCRQTPPFLWTQVWVQLGDPKSERTSSALSGSVWTAALLPVAAAPSLQLHMHTDHMLNVTVNSLMEGQRWATTAPSRQFSLSHASGLRLCLCVNSELIWQACSHPHTLRVHTAKTALANRISLGQWIQRD